MANRDQIIIKHQYKLLVLAVIFLLWDKTGIWYALSDSLPYKFYLLIKKRNYTPQKNSLVAIKGHNTAYVSGSNFIKVVGGIEGDRINIVNDVIWVNDLKIGKIREYTLDNKPLTPIATIVIPPGFVFVYTNHENSFDSRYLEFGLVNTRFIVGKVIPIW